MSTTAGATWLHVRDNDPLAFECEQAVLLVKSARQRIARALAIADGQVANGLPQKVRTDLREQLEKVDAQLDAAEGWAGNVVSVRVAEVTGDMAEWDD